MFLRWEFQVSTRIQFGWGLAGKLAESLTRWGRRVFWVGYRQPGGLEAVYEKLRGQWHEAGLVVEEFLELTGEPDVQVVNRGAEAARSFGAEVVVGVGGGSVLDTAKAVAALARMDGRLEDYLPIPVAGPFGEPAVPLASGASRVAEARSSAAGTRRIEHALPIIAVPTTSGTGSEVTSLAVFHWRGEEQLTMPMKLTLAAECLTPKLAVVDPELLVSCPPEVSVRCAMDALAHAMEAAISRRTNPLVQLLAEEAIVQIFTYLPAILARPADRPAREALALAATLAGIGLQQAGATLAHAMAHALGALATLPHGEAVARVSVPALRYNLSECAPIVARWAKRFQLHDQPEQELAEAFLQRLQSLLQKVGLGQGVRLPEIVGQDWPNRLAQNAFQSTPVALKLNPRKIDPLSLATLFREILP